MSNSSSDSASPEAGAAARFLGEPFLKAAMVVQFRERVGVNQREQAFLPGAKRGRHVVEDGLQQADLVAAVDVKALRPLAPTQQGGGANDAVQGARQAARHQRPARQRKRARARQREQQQPLEPLIGLQGAVIIAQGDKAHAGLHRAGGKRGVHAVVTPTARHNERGRVSRVRQGQMGRQRERSADYASLVYKSQVAAQRALQFRGQSRVNGAVGRERHQYHMAGRVHDRNADAQQQSSVPRHNTRPGFAVQGAGHAGVALPVTARPFLRVGRAHQAPVLIRQRGGVGVHLRQPFAQTVSHSGRVRVAQIQEARLAGQQQAFVGQRVAPLADQLRQHASRRLHIAPQRPVRFQARQQGQRAQQYSGQAYDRAGDQQQYLHSQRNAQHPQAPDKNRKEECEE